MSPRPALDCTTCGGRTGELLAYSTPGALFPPRDLGSSGPSSVAFRFFQDLAKDKGCSGSFIRANLLLPPSAFNNSGVARGRESGFGSESAGERLKGRKAKGEKGLGRTLAKFHPERWRGSACSPPGWSSSLPHSQQPSRPESHLLCRLVRKQQALRPGSLGADGSSSLRCSGPACQWPGASR